jgi:hypothetical protein
LNQPAFATNLGIKTSLGFFQPGNAKEALYTHLGEAEIRLLTVSSHDGTIASELETHPRTAAPEYDAVRYAWGHDKSTTSVVCNGFPLEIGTSLFTALPFVHASRPEPRTRPLWIDAICLNQDNPHEKEIHVPLMHEIYENASRTLVWLGVEGENSDFAMDRIESLTQKMLFVEDPDSLTIEETIINYDLPPPHDQIWEAIKRLLDRSWFFRE